MLLVGIGLISFVEQWVNSGVAAVIVGSMPIWVAALDWLLFRGGRPSLQTAIGLLMGFVGLVVLAAPSEQTTATGLNVLGFGLLIVATVGWAGGGLYSRHAPLPEDLLMATAAEMFAGGVMLMIASFILGEPRDFDITAVSLRSILAMLYLMGLGGIIGYPAYIWLMKNVEVAKVNTNFYVNPVIALFAGWLLAEEALSPHMVVAAAVILLGVAITTTNLDRWWGKSESPTHVSGEAGR